MEWNWDGASLESKESSKKKSGWLLYIASRNSIIFSSYFFN
ncbi:hypothetical protein LEP1GSC116_3953 [Leptospira interrogans serovar Icterohaemorrhagiae str. Verdun HP]|uniref:Uncharacterized protein n=1 Tax=Leptospira interrogans serovar Icterohaemorrhagiae str. Verdun HP TaxID=1049910 RepID=M6RDV4_LEPIR|nr:hypothetical protein LEP1GSC116_3953 [Leptospira interrogans serovar Icterohaemorrhagiae str. Verdun HP]